MKNLRIEQVEKYIKNGILLEYNLYNTFNKQTVSNRNNNNNNLLGWPNLVSVETFNTYVQKNPTFPKDLLKTYKMTVKRNYHDFYGKVYEYYILPYKLESIHYLNNGKNEEIIKNWSELVELYTQDNQSIDEYDSLENKLLKTSIELFTDSMLSMKNDLIKVTSRDFISAYIKGYYYRKALSVKCKESFFDLSLEEFYQEISQLSENKNDLVLIEQAIFDTNGYKNNYIRGIEQVHTELINPIKNKYFKDESIDIETPFLKYHRDMNLYDYKSEKRAAQTMVESLKKLKEWTFEVVKEDFLYFYNSSKKKPIVEYALSVLEENNAVPSMDEMLIEDKKEVIYRTNLTYNINAIKNMMNNNLNATITLLKIVENSYLKDEKPEYLSLKIEEEKAIATFRLEDKDENELNISIEKMKHYVSAALSEMYLIPETMKKLCKHNLHRVAYEDKDEVVADFKFVKDKYLAKEKLEKDLKFSDNSIKKVKKI